jgi:hypothetical protein
VEPEERNTGKLGNKTGENWINGSMESLTNNVGLNNYIIK